eukprot:TRINITY_DN313_c0_g1_i1.p1 TRINITY_DN313_c0_g1~~TRINITY_DN313_c0_g1_i1.p1  ORF type:complete len:1130 (+),score=225.49 TRINITY_DN313_c0_g1_i1:89-3478(+)
MEPVFTVKEEIDRRSGVPLVGVFFLVLAITATALVVLWWLGAQAAEDGVNDVAASLRRALVADIERQVYDFLGLPYAAVQVFLAARSSGTYSLTRADAYGHTAAGPRSVRAAQWMLDACRQVATVDAVFFGTEYAHFGIAFCERSLGKGANSNWTFSLCPPVDQVREGVPAWTIPCRYRSNCSQIYRHRPDYRAYCEDPADPWAHQENCVDRQTDCRPYWAAGRGDGTRQCPTGPNPTSAPFQCYTDLQPPHATWAHALNVKGRDPTFCRPDATSVHPPCENFCPEFNRTYYKTNERGEFMMSYRTRSDYDPRSRSWYKWSKQQKTRAYTNMYICSTSRMPCFSAIVPLRVAVPDIGAVVVLGRRRAVVVGHTATVEHMYAIRVRHSDGAEEVVDAEAVRLPCTSIAACQESSADPGACADACAADAALPGPAPDALRQTTQDRLVGIVGGDYESRGLSDAMDSIEVGKTGGLFIVERDEDASLVAVSSSLPCEATRNARPDESPRPTCFVRQQEDEFGRVDVNADPVRVSAYETHAGPVVNGVMSSIFPGRNHGGVGRRSVVASVGSEDYWVEVVPINPMTGPAGAPLGIGNVDWILFVVLPHRDFLAEANAAKEDTLAISISVICVVAAVLAAVGFGFIAAPIRILITDLAEAQEMRIDAILARHPRFTPLREMSELQASFRVLCHFLREYRSFLPQALLDAGDESSAEEKDLENGSGSVYSDTGSRLEKGSVTRVRRDRAGSSASNHSRQSRRSNDSGISAGHTKPAAGRAGRSGGMSSFLAPTAVLRTVSVVMGNIAGLHNRCAQPLILRESLRALVLVLHEVTTHSKGTLDGVVGDRTRISWNAGRLIGSHRARAVLAAAQLMESSTVPPMTLAVGTGDAVCGNFGDTPFRYHGIIGPVCSFAHICERYASRFLGSQGPAAVCEQRLCAEQTAVQYRWQCRLGYSKRPGPPVNVFVILGIYERQGVESQEWMYALADAEDHAPYKEYNRAIIHAVSGHHDAACELLRALPPDSPQLPHAADLLQRIEAFVAGSGPDPTAVLQVLDVGVRAASSARGSTARSSITGQPVSGELEDSHEDTTSPGVATAVADGIFNDQQPGQHAKVVPLASDSPRNPLQVTREHGS